MHFKGHGACGGVKKQTGIKVNAQGQVVIEDKPAVFTTEISCKFRCRQALQRRSLALDQADLISHLLLFRGLLPARPLLLPPGLTRARARARVLALSKVFLATLWVTGLVTSKAKPGATTSTCQRAAPRNVRMASAARACTSVWAAAPVTMAFKTALRKRRSRGQSPALPTRPPD